MTDRRGLASAGSLLLILGSTAIVNLLVFGLGASTNLLVLSLSRLPFELALRIFTLSGLPTNRPRAFGSPISSPLPTGLVVAASVAVTLIAAGVTWWHVSRRPGHEVSL